MVTSVGKNFLQSPANLKKRQAGRPCTFWVRLVNGIGLNGMGLYRLDEIILDRIVQAVCLVSCMR